MSDPKRSFRTHFAILLGLWLSGSGAQAAVVDSAAPSDLAASAVAGCIVAWEPAAS